MAWVLSSCQSDIVSTGDVKAKDVKPPPSTAVTEAFGDKGAEITLLLTKAPVGYFVGDARDVRDGAALATGELGGDFVHVRVTDVSRGAAVGLAEVAAAQGRGSVLLVSDVPGTVTSAIAALPADRRPLLINVGRQVNASGNMFNFAEDETDSAMAGVKIAATNGRRKFLVFVPSDYPASHEAAILTAIRAAGGAAVAVTRYAAGSAGVTEAALAVQAAAKNADAALILGNTSNVVGLVASLKSSGASPKMAFFGTSAWPEEALSLPGANGVIIASADRTNRTLIAERYSRRYGRPLSPAAAYGYDAVAIASGVVRTNGAAGLTSDLLTRKAGFTGVTGLFHLSPSGQVERKLLFYSVTNGKLERMAAQASIGN